MGEVYRARDRRLNRDVALKVLPSSLSADPERLLRLRREAQLLASLNHQNIAAIYGLEEGQAADAGGAADALVLELIEGPTLAERMAEGPLPLDAAVEIAIQIAHALEAAHERGIVHRDLKPANVKIRPDGMVKVLDFGLAKAWEPSTGEPAEVSSAPTLTSPMMTRAGIVLGTAAYMSPEQARGGTVDRRTDVWAFGCVLFEMLAGRHAFGEMSTVSDAIAAVLKGEPDWQALPAATPPHVRALLKRCLEKDPRRRLRDMGDAGLLLAEEPRVADAPGSLLKTALPPAAPPGWLKWVAITGWAAALVLGSISALGIAGGFRSGPAPPAAPLRLALPLGSPLKPGTLVRPFAVSPDGTRIVYMGLDSTGSSLYLQDLTGGELERLPGTADADAPAFAPDGRAIAFRSGSAVKVLPLNGGLPREVAKLDAGQVYWTWSGSEHIVLAGMTGLWRAPLHGGSPEQVEKLAAGEVAFSSASPLPGGAYLASVRATTTTDDASRVVVMIPGQPERLVVAERGSRPTFVAGQEANVGHIVYAEAGRLIALPFDATRRAVTGAAVPILENVAMRPNGDLAEYAVSPAGTLVFREGSLHELVTIERGSGAVQPLSAKLRRFALPRLSPDGRRLAVEIQDSPHQIWMLDIERDVLAPLTTEPAGSHDFAWAPDGRSIAYTLGDLTSPQVGWIRTDGSPAPGRIAIAADARVGVYRWSRDGQFALMVGLPPRHAVMTLRLEAGTPPKATAKPVTIADGLPGSFSPDGAWLAYCNCDSVDANPANVFIQHLQTGARHQVSVDGGTEPVWAAGGRELFFRAGSRMMAAALTFDGSAVRIGRPQPIFEGEYLEWGTGNYDVTSDGTQFVMVRAVAAQTRTLSVRLNWTTELERLVPVRP